MKIEIENGINWLEPKHINLNEIADKLATGILVSEIRSTYNLDDGNLWAFAANAIFSLWKARGGYPSGEDVINDNVNKMLSPYSLCFPPYGTRPEMKDIEKLLTHSPAMVKEATQIIFASVMHPRMRALQLVGRFQKLDIFQEFAYFIESSTLSYYRGNIACAFLTLLPCIEGILLRWQGFPSVLTKKPDFEKTKKFINKSIQRQPVPKIPAFFDSWVKTIDEILQQHLYKHSDSGDAFNQFNRHLALHMLDDKDFCSHENVMRAFLVIDLLSEIYICEKHIPDPRWAIKLEEEAPHIEAYNNALLPIFINKAPESILRNYSKHK